MTVAVVVSLLLALAPPAAVPAKVRAEAKAHFAKGNAAYAVGRFEEALAEFNAAYDQVHAPELIFNIGQCHLNLGHYDDAAFFYEKYLGLRPQADVARAQLAEARRLAAEQREAAAREADAARLAEEARLAAAQQAKLAETRRIEEARHAEAERARRAAAAARAARDDEDARNAWLMWGGIGAGTVVVAAAVAGAAVIFLSPQPQTVLPAGSLGVVDRRGAS